MDLYGHTEDPVCPDCHRPYRYTGDLAFFVDGEWICRKCFLEWAREEMSDVDIAEALGVRMMPEIDL